MSSPKYLKKQVLQLTYDTTVDGGTKNTAITIGQIPARSIITGAGLVTKTDFVGDTTTISLGYTGAAAAFLAATTATTMDAGEILSSLVGAPAVGSNASTLDAGTSAIFSTRVAASQIYLDAAKNVLVTLSNDNDLTAGKAIIFIEYMTLK